MTSFKLQQNGYQVNEGRPTERIADRNSYTISIGNRQDKQPLGQRKNK